MKSPAKLTKSQNACGCSAVGETIQNCRTSNGFLTFFFAIRRSARESSKSWNHFSCFFHFRNVAVVHTPLEILTKCCSGPKKTLIFDLSVFAKFTKSACGPCGVKNSLFAKKHRNRSCVENPMKTNDSACLPRGFCVRSSSLLLISAWCFRFVMLNRDGDLGVQKSLRTILL